MKTIKKYLNDIEKEKNVLKRTLIARKTCEYILSYLRLNKVPLNQKNELKLILEKLLIFCERNRMSKNKNEITSVKSCENTKTKELALKNNEESTFTIEPGTKNTTDEYKVVGLENVQKALYDGIKLSIDHPELFKGHRRPSKFILLYGPPGTGKTYIINTIKKYNINVMKITASDLFSKYQGESEKKIKKLFDESINFKPCAIFIDEIDFICRDREESNGGNESSNRIKSELLIRMSEMEKIDGVYIIGATNFPWALDPAFLRRFHKKLYVGLPNQKMREDLFRFFLGQNNVNLSDQDFYLMAKRCEMFSSSDIKLVSERMLCSVLDQLQNEKCFIKKDGKWTVCKYCKDFTRGKKCLGLKGYEKAGSFCEVDGEIEEPEVSIENFKNIISKCKSCINSDYLEKYEKWTEIYGEDTTK